jgi:hypothetical protein
MLWRRVLSVVLITLYALGQREAPLSTASLEGMQERNDA